MYVKKISTEQFAGLTDKTLALKNGMNLICQPNESGKSTVASLLSGLLCSAYSDNINGKKWQYYLPNDGKCDFIDGKVTLVSDDGEYLLKKTWTSSKKDISLTNPSGGKLKKPEIIREILKQNLKYGEGVYRSILLSNQKNADSAIPFIEADKLKAADFAEFEASLGEMFSDVGGVTVADIEQIIAAEKKRLSDAYWDVENDRPKFKTSGEQYDLRQSGEVRRAWTRLDSAEKAKGTCKKLNEAVTKALTEKDQLKQAYQNAKDKFNAFNNVKTALESREQINMLYLRATDDVKNGKDAKKDWPYQQLLLEEAQTLKKQKETAELLADCKVLAEKHDAVSNKTNLLQNMIHPSEDEVRRASSLENEISACNAALGEISLQAAVNLLNGHSVHVFSEITGEEIKPVGGKYSIDSAVKICIPDVLEMVLSKPDIDAEAEKQKQEHARQELQEILKKYDAENAEALAICLKKYNDEQSALVLLQEDYSRFAGMIRRNRSENLEELRDDSSDVWDILSAWSSSITDTVPSVEKSEEAVRKLCGELTIDQFIGAKQSVVKGYIDAYGTPADLACLIACKEKVVAEAEAKISTENIPEEFLDIEDTVEYAETLKNRFDKTSEKFINYKGLDDAENALNNFLILHGGDEAGETLSPEAEFEAAKADYDRKLTELKRWLHIEDVFTRLKDKLESTPMAGLSESFNRYLRFISGGRLDSEFNDSTKIDISVRSGRFTIGKNELSNGTRDTVAFAFRLAMIEQLFPDGGAVTVFDDPFTEMDRERTAAACEMLKEFAKKNQVIFMTCDEKYSKLLGTESIEIESA